MGETKSRQLRQRYYKRKRLAKERVKKMSEATRTPVNSIEIPAEYVELCHRWHGNINCLTLGNRQTYGSDTKEQWYLSIWQGLSVDVMRARLAAEKEPHDDCATLLAFEDWVDAIVDRLTEEYKLENLRDSMDSA
jgi:hypothetical protein